ncbi:hypothetical protein BKA82DRAFT_4009190 [Pisolithus tinctorius]|nr:hypothetical protein BKA82DRAFT_4009190 [Pisolithus tinctorius]
MPEWFPWKAAVERVLRIPHLLNTDGWKAGNSLINGTYIQGAACEVWVTQISSDSCPTGVHGKPLLNGRKAGNSLINGTYIQGAAYWCPWKAAVERVLWIPHPLNTDGWKAGNSLINGTYIQGAAYWCPWKAAVERVLRIPHPLNTDGRKAGNSLINGTYIQGAACEVWVTQISSDSCQNGVHGKLLFSGCWGYHIRSIQMSGWLAILQFMADWCPCKAAVERVLRIPHPLNTDGQKAGNSLINGTYIQGAAYWCPWKAAVERVLRIPHPLNTDGRKAGNSLINGTYIQGAACEVWVTQISSDSCQNGVHGKLLFSGCWGYHIRSIQMSRWLAIV